jgi:hypothetical protein
VHDSSFEWLAVDDVEAVVAWFGFADFAAAAERRDNTLVTAATQPLHC